MLPGLFDLEQMATVAELTAPHRDTIYADFAGHVHVNTEYTLDDQGFDVYTTAATHGATVTVRLVEVWGNGLGFEYQHELVEVPWQAR